MSIDDTMDFTVNNFAPDMDTIKMIFGNHEDSTIEVIIERDKSSNVFVSVTDHFDGSQKRYILGEPGFTEKL